MTLRNSPAGDAPTIPYAIRGKRSLRRGIRSYDVVVTVIAVLFALLVAYPLVRMLISTFFPTAGGFDLSPIAKALSDPVLGQTLLNTLLIIGSSAVIAVLIATVFAWLNERTDARMAWASRIFPLLPLLLPPIVLSIGWVFLAEKRSGFLNVILRSLFPGLGDRNGDGPLDIYTIPGLIFVFTVFLVPYAYLVIAPAVRNIDPVLEEASRMSGASLFATLRRVTISSIFPVLVSSLLLTVIIGLSGYSISSTIGLAANVQLLPVYLVRLVSSYPPNLDSAVVVGLLVLIFVFSLWALQRRILARGAYAKLSGRGGTSLVRLGRWKWVARVVTVLYLIGASVGPLLSVILVALEPFWTPKIQFNHLTLNNFINLFSGTSPAPRALATSLTLGLVGATIAVTVALVLTLYIRQNSGRFGGLIDGLMKAPGGVSHIVLGVAFIIAFAGAPFQLGGTPIILLLAYIVMYMPQASIATETGLSQVPVEMLEVSSMSGATSTQTVRRIILPLVLPALAGGWAMCFLVMAGDLTASALLSSSQAPVIGMVILTIWDNGTFAPLAALGSILGIISAITIGLVLFLSRPRYRDASLTRTKV